MTARSPQHQIPTTLRKADVVGIVQLDGRSVISTCFGFVPNPKFRLVNLGFNASLQPIAYE